MSYRSIKRVLGETSLERKCRFLFGACLFVLIAASFWVYGWQTEQLVYLQNRMMGRLLVDRTLLIHHAEQLQSMEKKGTDATWTEDPLGKKFLPVLKSITENLGNQTYESSFIRPSSNTGMSEPRNAFECGLVNRWNKPNPTPSANTDDSDCYEQWPQNENVYIYYQAVRAKESCLRVCHRAPPGGQGVDLIGTGIAMGGVTAQAPGDLLAIVKITIPSGGPTKTELNKNRALLFSTAIITVMLAMIASYVIVRYVIVKPLRHLRDVSDTISRGDVSQRADIHTGDEFEELAVAFNRMLRHLTAIQEELRQANVNLDLKVDELAQANMRLYELNMLKSDFLATMSHELRTPLNSILGFSELLGSINVLDEKQKRYVQNIQNSGRTLLEMINDILDLAKIESGKMDMRISEFRIEQVVGAQCDMARPLSEKKNIDLRQQIKPNLPPMRQDQSRVGQILNNLLSNAIKFTPEGGWITVTAERDEENFLLLKVSDTGVGIAEEDRQVIFEKFRQGRTAMPTGEAITREHSGSGLGLSIVKEMCKLLGGEISVQSDLGKGSTFTVRLPWRLQEQPGTDSTSIAPERFAEFAKPRTL
ncbi:MAG: ATP-binding protein [Thermoguttaceae bacterium]